MRGTKIVLMVVIIVVSLMFAIPAIVKGQSPGARCLPGDSCYRGPAIIQGWPPTAMPPSATVTPFMAWQKSSPTSSPDAPHHAAIVEMRSGRNGGSGTLIFADGDVGYVLTVQHLVEGNRHATATWASGYASTGPVIGIDTVTDLALIRVKPPPGAVSIPVVEEGGYPVQGDCVELCGWGGDRLRHWSSTVDGYALTSGMTDKYLTLQVRSGTISGDSGGPILFKGRLAGVIWGGPNRTPGGVVHPVRGTCCLRIRAFLRRVLGRNLPRPDKRAAELPPPTYPRHTPDIPSPPQPPVPTQPVDTPGLTARLDAIEARLLALEARPQIDCIAETADLRAAISRVVDGLESLAGRQADLQSAAGSRRIWRVEVDKRLSAMEGRIVDSYEIRPLAKE